MLTDARLGELWSKSKHTLQPNPILTWGKSNHQEKSIVPGKKFKKWTPQYYAYFVSWSPATQPKSTSTGLPKPADFLRKIRVQGKKNLDVSPVRQTSRSDLRV